MYPITYPYLIFKIMEILIAGSGQNSEYISQENFDFVRIR